MRPTSPYRSAGAGGCGPVPPASKPIETAARYAAIALLRLASILSRKAWVFSQG